MTRLSSVCPACGEVFERDSRNGKCPKCRPDDKRDWQAHDMRRGKTAARGYGSAWQRLSRKARELQPFCLDCGSPEDLTTDHTPEAWRRIEAGKVLRLKDVEVVCRRCNSDRGAARGENIAAWRDQ